MKKLTALALSLLLLVTAIIPMFAFNVSAANKVPNVLPVIREWEGGTGKFVPNAETVIVCNDASAAEQIKLVQEFFADMLGLQVALSTTGKSNAVVFKLDSSACNGEKEGYELEATKDSITIKSATEIGLLYGGITVVQSCYADGYFPVGKAMDYPEYPVRSGMLDVARQYIPMNDLYEITKYMAWYKLNEFHVHLNDNGKNDYTAFRLECETYPELTSKDGHYTKAEYKQYQLDMAKYGITIISEIDSPYHSDCFRNIEGVKFIEKATLDLSDATTVGILKNIWTEYISGDDPVFVKKSSGETVVHIGMDEYPISRKSEIIAYAQQIINLVNENGYTARFWSGAGVSGDGVGGDGCLGGANFTGDYQVDYWDFNMSGITETAEMGCPVVNLFSAHLYVVPGSDETGIDGFENKLTKDTLEKIWNERKWEVNVGRWNGQTVLDADDPNLLGASFGIWNDWGSAWFGLTYHDIIDRFSLSACFIAEKTWGGSATSFSTFYSLYETHGFRVGTADPFGTKPLDNKEISIDFSETFPVFYNENSVVNGAYVLNGDNPISLGEGFVGFPNTLSFDIILDELPSQKTALFAGYGNCGIDIYIDSDGTIGIKSKINEDTDETKAAYFFTYDYKLEAGRNYPLMFTCDGDKTLLILGNGEIRQPINSRQNEAYFGSQNNPLNDPTAVPNTTLFATAVIPLEEVGTGIKGVIDNITIENAVADLSFLMGGVNVAEGSKATASSLLNNTQTPNLAVDGKTGNRVAFGNDADEQWLLLDLGRAVPINKLEINYFQTVSSYEILVSENGTDFIKVYETDKQKAGISKNIKIQLETAYNARYVKYLQRARFEDEGKLVSGAIKEFAVITADAEFYNTVYDSAITFANSLESSDSRKAKINTLAGELKKLLGAEPFYYASAEAIRNQIEEAKTEIEEPNDTPNEDSSSQSEIPSQSQSTTSENDLEEGGMDGLTIAIIVIAVVLVIGGVVFVIIKKGKKN